MIPLYKIYWDESDIESVASAIKEGMYWAGGPAIERFEQLLAGYIGVKYAVTFNSGTSALHALLLAHGIGQGDEVIVPSFTFQSTVNAVVMTGAKPVFTDIEPDTFALDINDVIYRITKKTKAIILVHYAGIPAEYSKIVVTSINRGILVFEDNAESMGASIERYKLGSLGDGAILSFCGNKIITTGEGGAALTSSPDICDKLKIIRSHGRFGEYFKSFAKPDYVSLGYNYRMSNITAALGISQLKKIGKLIDLRRHNAKLLCNMLGINFRNDSVYQMFPILSDRRDELAKHLIDNGVSCKAFFDPPVHLTNYYRYLKDAWQLRDVKLPVTEEISKKILCLPIYPDITESEIESIARAYENFA